MLIREIINTRFFVRTFKYLVKASCVWKFQILNSKQSVYGVYLLYGDSKKCYMKIVTMEF